MSEQVHHRTCTLCEALCGLTIETRDGDVLSIKGDPNDPLSQGFLCPKAVALQDLQKDLDRLRQPVRRTDQGWEPMPWSEALNYVAQRLLQIKAQHGSQGLGVYVGNPNVHNHGNMLFMLPFLKALGTKKRFSATSLDQLPHMLANLQLFGHQALFPVPDIDRTDLFICWGANPLASNGSLMTAPGMDRRLKALQQRGGKLITIDPRRTETAQRADQHIFIKPSTDVLMLLAMLRTLYVKGWVQTGHLQSVLLGVDKLRAVVEPYRPETVARVCGVEAETIVELTRAFASTRNAVLYGRMGTSVQAFGGLSTWLIYCLNLLTGHMDRRGGMMFTLPAIDLVALGALGGQQGNFDRYRSRLRGLPEFGGELPAAALAEEILEPGKGQIRGLVTVAGNPVLSAPNGVQLERALETLDFMVSIDMYVTETSRHADVILPPTGPLERSHLDIIFPMVAVRNTVKYSPPVLPKTDGSLHDWEIMLELTRRLTSTGLQETLVAEARTRLLRQLGPDGLADILLQAGPYGRELPLAERWSSLAGSLLETLPLVPDAVRQLWRMGPLGERHRNLPKNLSLQRLRDAPHGIDLGPLRPCLPDRLFTADGKIQIAPQLYLQEVAQVAELLNSSEAGLTLIGRRHVRSNNSWMHNSLRLVKGKPRCTLMMHPQDAAAAGLEEGFEARVTSRVGQVQIPVEITEDIMPGVVSIPHGWGHHRMGISQQTAAQHAGASLNDLTDELRTDRLTGTAVLNGIPVTVTTVRPGAGSAAPEGSQASQARGRKTAAPRKARSSKAVAKG
ncbi:MAG: molybdopterin oxidoreductase family protein [Hahellaceae bacterium]|nr:molybdopterin oxidoreductase family protein [Hahellaceae bacterium]